MEVWYLYTLSKDGTVFYVGITRNVKNRYRGHLSCQDMCTGNTIYWMRQEGSLPGLEIIHCVRTQKEAEIAESAVIRQLCLMGNKLCNVDINPAYNRLIDCYPHIPRIRIKRINKNVIPEIISEAKDRFHKLIFYQNYEQKDRLQYLGNSARVS